MKQGSGNSTRSAGKVEPNPRAVNPGGVAQLGVAVGPRRAVEQVYDGRGLKAPMAGEQQHHTGSQGKHK